MRKIARAVPAPWPALWFAGVGDARQVLVVTGDGSRPAHGTLRALRLGPDGHWRTAFPVLPARTGWGGWQPADRRVQDDGSTPQGTFRISTAFGLRPDPGTKLPYRHAGGTDHWAGDQRDPATYNLGQPAAAAGRTWRLAEAERLADYPVQYAYAAVIDFNRPEAATVTFDPRRQQYVTSHPATCAAARRSSCTSTAAARRPAVSRCAGPACCGSCAGWTRPGNPGSCSARRRRPARPDRGNTIDGSGVTAYRDRHVRARSAAAGRFLPAGRSRVRGRSAKLTLPHQEQNPGKGGCPPLARGSVRRRLSTVRRSTLDSSVSRIQ